MNTVYIAASLVVVAGDGWMCVQRSLSRWAPRFVTLRPCISALTSFLHSVILT